MDLVLKKTILRAPRDFQPKDMKYRYEFETDRIASGWRIQNDLTCQDYYTGFKVKGEHEPMKKSAGKQEEYKVKLAEKYSDAPS